MSRAGLAATGAFLTHQRTVAQGVDEGDCRPGYRRVVVSAEE